MDISILFSSFSDRWWTTAEGARLMGTDPIPFGRQLARFVPPPGWALDQGAARGLRRYRVRKVAPILGPSARAVEAACGDVVRALFAGVPAPLLGREYASAFGLVEYRDGALVLTEFGLEVAREIGGGR